MCDPQGVERMTKSKIDCLGYAGSSLTLWQRFWINTVVVFPMMGLYTLISRCGVSATELTMPHWVPFVPAFILPYAVMLLATWLLPLVIRDARLFRACILANLSAYLLVMPWWQLCPTMLTRPDMPSGFWQEIYRCLWAFDPPRNIMPCAHGVGPAVAAWFVGRDRPRWRWPLAFLLILSMPSIAFTWQHRPIDIFVGLLAAAAGIAGAEFLYRGRPQSSCLPSPPP